MPRSIVILGAGISGLTHAWYLKKKWQDEISITLLERSSKVGGWIQTSKDKGFIFEEGPRSCRSKGFGAATLQLIEELGLENQMIGADPAAQNRYLYTNQNLLKLPTHFFSIIRSPYAQDLLKFLWRDIRGKNRSPDKEESIFEAFSRWFGPNFSSQLIDPFISGIYAGDMHKLSLKACFPQLYQMEKEHSSLILGMMKAKKRKLTSPFALFSFKEGMQTLPRELARQINAEIKLNCSVSSIEKSQEGYKVVTEDGSCLYADELISTLPTHALAPIIKQCGLINLSYATVAIVNLGYQKQTLKHKGFGYLIPKSENESILGCVWDSCVFPEQNQTPEELRLTIMLGGVQHPSIEGKTENELLSLALDAVDRHLGIVALPHAINVKIAKKAIPQYEVGYETWKEKMYHEISESYPKLILSGSGWNGVSVNECIQRSRD